MKILFVLPLSEKYTGAPAAPLGALSLCTYLNRHGHDSRIFDRRLQSDFEAYIDEFKPEIIGISFMSALHFSDAKQISETARRHGITSVAGGPIVSTMPEQMLKNGIGDIVSISEGELSWLDLTEYYGGKRKLEEVRSIAYLEDGKLVKTPRAPFIDLAELGDLDWSLIRVRDYFETYYGCKNGLHLFASKGCHGACTFCFNPYFHACKRRVRPMDDVIREIVYLHDTYDMQSIYFSDEYLGGDKEWMYEFCRRIKELDLNIRWGGQTRADLYERADYDMMYDAGCRWLLFGLETGSPKMQKIINKKLDLEFASMSVGAARAAGINTIPSFIIALPGETADMMRETIDFARRLRTDQHLFNYYVPLAGSAMYNNLPDHDELWAQSFDLQKVIDDMLMFQQVFKVRKNYSEIPDRDLKVVRAYFLWHSFWATDNTSESVKHSFALKTATDAIKNLFGQGVGHFFVQAVMAFAQIWFIFYNRYFFPGVRKKYGLDGNFELPVE